MKELSIEDKARAYDEALKYAKIYYTNGDEDMKMMMKTCFPVLVEESEDERIIGRIKKAVESYWSDEPLDEIIAWLEKQAEQKPTEEYNITGIGSKHAQGKLGEMIKNLKPISKVLEQNPTDNAEPKFKQGDWIVFNGLVLHIKAVVKGYYITTSEGGITNGYDWNIDNAARLWTIQDAKNGDVLYALPTESNKPFIFIFDNIDALGFIKSYYKYDSEYGLKEDKHLFIGSVRGKYLPATKEQCDLLLQKMKEAGKKIYNIHAE